MIDLHENYGGHLICGFAARTGARTVVDLGAGQGDDLRNIQGILPGIRCHGVEGHKPFQLELAKAGIYSLPTKVRTRIDSLVDLPCICPRIPTGFRTKAQGCALRATLGNDPIA